MEESECNRLMEFTMENPAIRFVRGNLSPVASTSVDLLTGKNFIGDPTRDGIMSFTKEIIAGNLIPIWTQSVLFEGGTPQDLSIRGVVEFVGGRAYPETTWDKVKPLREKYAQEDFNRDYASLNRSQIDQLRRDHQDLNDLEEGAKREWAEKGTDFEKWYFDANEKVTKERNDSFENAAQAFEGGNISKQEYDNQRKFIRPYFSGGKAVLWDAKDTLDPKASARIERWIAENQAPESSARDR